jgi:hypothetical protein
MKLIVRIIAPLAVVSTVTISSLSQSPEAHRHKQFPHPLNATMGIPDPVGSYNVRVNSFRQVHNEEVSYDLGGHLSYGMFDWGGLHLRSLGVKTTPFTELIGMAGLWRNESRTQGVSLLGIVGVPTAKKDGKEHHGLAYLAGVAGRLAKEGLVTNDIILHYDFSAQHFIAETGSVMRLMPGLFATLDARGTFGSNSPDISLLSALKMQVTEIAYLALGYHTPVTNARSFAHQVFVQLEIGSH